MAGTGTFSRRYLFWGGKMEPTLDKKSKNSLAKTENSIHLSCLACLGSTNDPEADWDEWGEEMNGNQGDEGHDEENWKVIFSNCVLSILSIYKKNTSSQFNMQFVLLEYKIFSQKLIHLV